MHILYIGRCKERSKEVQCWWKVSIPFWDVHLVDFQMISRGINTCEKERLVEIVQEQFVFGPTPLDYHDKNKTINTRASINRIASSATCWIYIKLIICDVILGSGSYSYVRQRKKSVLGRLGRNIRSVVVGFVDLVRISLSD